MWPNAPALECSLDFDLRARGIHVVLHDALHCRSPDICQRIWKSWAPSGRVVPAVVQGFGNMANQRWIQRFDEPDQKVEVLKGMAVGTETSCFLYPRDTIDGRSEEHTSELQSLRHLVCRLLLE